MMKAIRRVMIIFAAASAVQAHAANVDSGAADVDAQAAALGQCLVNKSTGEDRVAVARWMLAAMASGPTMAGFVEVDPSKKVALDKGMAAIFTRLMTVDCVGEARPLFDAKNALGFRVAGEALGRIAMRELMADPAAEKAIAAYGNYLQESDFATLLK